MGRARVCIVEGDGIDVDRLDCGNGSHYHISREEAQARALAGEFEWLKEPQSRRDKGVARVLKHNYRLRGLSCKVGATLAEALRNKEAWAQVMLKDIRHA